MGRWASGWRGIGVAAWLCAGCAAPGMEVRVEADDTRTGLDGEDGPFGAGLVEAQRSQGAKFEVTVPLVADDEVLEGPLPVFVHVNGGRVDPERYRWIADHLATQGWVVVAPYYPLDLALFAAGNTQDAYEGLLAAAEEPGWLEGVADADSFRAVGGHSLGGVTASVAWADGGWDALVLEASYPADGTDVESVEGPVLSVLGSQDGLSARADVKAGLDRFPGPTQLEIIEGMTHFSWVTDPTERELAKEETPDRPPSETRVEARGRIDAFLQALLQEG